MSSNSTASTDPDPSRSVLANGVSSTKDKPTPFFSSKMQKKHSLSFSFSSSNDTQTTIDRDSHSHGKPGLDAHSRDPPLSRRFRNFHNHSSRRPVIDSPACSSSYGACPLGMSKAIRVSFPQDSFISPYLMSDEQMAQMPPLSILACHFDPFLDDCIELAKHADRLGVLVNMRVLDHLPHAFLNFIYAGPEFQRGNSICIEMLKQLLRPDSKSSISGESKSGLFSSSSSNVVSTTS
ncbi:unnamed protein product [Protopolystoma xenopodis]|uniref:Alpha/beta hydrolase fold-3 domain-containing protein n=1 Tax=Protopolystoma xenopodis TaxID=117903 RepID=A0A3S5C5U3_9PLAT|nr:unnamed protein product [Protopolystoma xenopodis]